MGLLQQLSCKMYISGLACFMASFLNGSDGSVLLITLAIQVEMIRNAIIVIRHTKVESQSSERKNLLM